MRGTVDVAMLQTLARRPDLAELTAGYGFVVVDECHHIPAAAFENAVRQVGAKRWLGLIATPYRRDQLDDLIAQQIGAVRHTMSSPEPGTLAAAALGDTPDRQLTVHPTSFVYRGPADPAEPGQVGAKRWLGLTATPYRRDQLDDLIGQQVGPVRHTMSPPEPGTLAAAAFGGTPDRQLTVHPTSFVYRGTADPTEPGGIAAIYRDLAADEQRNAQVVHDVVAAVRRGRHCLVLSQWTGHVDGLAARLRDAGFDPVVLKGGMRARERTAALDRLRPEDGSLLVVATGPYVGEGFDCPALDTLFLAAPIAFKGRLVQYVGRVLRPAPGKVVAEVHDYHDVHTPVLGSSLAKRAPGYRSLGFADPRRR